jgi:hypothetical protein
VNTQEAYDAIREYFSKPDAILAKSQGGRCEYRTAEGRGCAVGCLIPDGLYDPKMENHVVDTVFMDFPAVGKYFEGVDMNFLLRAQSLHDDQSDTAFDFVLQLDELAQEYDLELAK